MPEQSNRGQSIEAGNYRPLIRKRRWFMGGFALILILSLFCVTRKSPSLSGIQHNSYRLWQYYTLEIRRDSTPGSYVPPWRSGFEPTVVLIQHLVISLAGGLFAVGIATVYNRVRQPRDSLATSSQFRLLTMLLAVGVLSALFALNTRSPRRTVFDPHEDQRCGITVLSWCFCALPTTLRLALGMQNYLYT